MATHEFYIYAASALPYDPNTGTFTFDPNYDHTEDRVHLSISDDDQFLDGDAQNDEVGEDANQTGVATKPDGTLVDSGNIYAEQYGMLEAPDGSIIYIDRIEIDGQLIGYSPSQELTPGVTYTYVGGSDIDDAPGGDSNADNRMTYGQYQSQSVPCFVSGTMLVTRHGLMPVDWIEAGDALWTQDHGWQIVRWRGHRPFEARPDFPKPIEIAPGALGPGTPGEVLRVSPQHRILLSGPLCALHFGVEEVLVAATHLRHWPGISEVNLHPDLAYHHLLFDRHEVLSATNVGVESLFLGDQQAQTHPNPPWALARALSGGHRHTSRLCLTGREARALPPGAFPATLLQPDPGSVAKTEDADLAASVLTEDVWPGAPLEARTIPSHLAAQQDPAALPRRVANG